jgi:lipoprotein-releasing system permease protein
MTTDSEMSQNSASDAEHSRVEATSRGLALVLARRLLTHGENRFARFVTWVSFLGLALGVMILTVVITVMNGFDSELKTRLLQSVPHITVAGAKAGDSLEGVAGTLPEVASVHEYFQGLGALSIAGRVQPVTIYAVGEEGMASLGYLQKTLQQGSFAALQADVNGMLVGAPLARYLGLRVGDPIVLLAIATSADGVAPKLLRFTLLGTFELGAEPDYGLVIVNINRQSSAQWQTMGSQGLQVQLHEALQAPGVARQLSAELPELEVDTWVSAYGELFQAVQLEKSMMFVLLLLVVAIASFNIIAGQTMVVNDKRASIAILRTMGCTAGLIRQVFLLQGVCIGLLGTLIGLGLGLLCAGYINEIMSLIASVSGRHLLDGSFFVEIPVRILPADLIVIGLMSCGLCLLSAWFPARRAAQMDPVAALH